MNPPSPHSWPYALRRAILLLAVLCWLPVTSRATTYYWDGSPNTTGTTLNYTSGTISASSSNWWSTSGTSYIGWTNSTGDTMQIGSGSTQAGRTYVSGSNAPSFVLTLSGTISLNEILVSSNLSSGGTNTVTITDGGSASNVLAFGNNTVIQNESADALVIDAVFSNTGGGGFMDESSGTVMLTKNNTYINGTTIEGAGSGFAPGGVLQVGTGGTAGALGSGGITFAMNTSQTGTSTLRFSRSDAISVGNSITIASANTLGGIIQQNGGNTLTLSGSVNLNNASSALTYNIGKTSQTIDTLEGGVVSGTGSIIKSGSGTLAFSANNSYGGTTTISAGILQIGNSGASGSLGLGAVTISSGTLAFNRTDSVTVSNTIGGAGSLNQNGSGTITLTGTNTYTGPTTVNAGILSTAFLALGGLNSGIGASSNVAANLVINGGTLQYTGAAVNVDRNFTIGDSNATIDASGSGALAMTGTAGYATGNAARTLTLTGTSAAANAYGGVLADNGSGLLALTKAGTGTWLLTGANTYSGTTTISGGTLQIGNGGSTGSLGSGSVSLNAGTLAFNVGTSLAVPNTISGGGSVSQTGTGTTTLSGSNSYSGATNIAAGTLQIGSNNALGTGTATMNSAFAGAGSLALAGGITVGNSLVVNAMNTGNELVNVSGSNTLNGTLTWSTGGTEYGVNALAGSLLISGSVAPAGSSKTLNVSGAGSVTFSGAILDTSNGGSMLSITKAGAGTLALSGGGNTYTGVTTISGGVLTTGILANSGSASGIGAATNVAANLVINGGTLQYTGGVASTDHLFSVGTGGGTIDASGSGALNFTNTGSLGFNSQSGPRVLTLTGGNAGANTLAAVIGDNGGATSLVKSGSGSWVLSGSNTYSGGTVLSSGTLQISNGGALGTGTANINSGATGNTALAITGGITVANPLIANAMNSGDEIINVSGSNTLSGAVSWSTGGTEYGVNSQAGTLTIGGAVAPSGSSKTLNVSGSGNVVFTGGIADTTGGTLSLSKSGAGMLTLSGSDNYSGATTVAAGKLLVTGSLSSSAATVSSGASLEADGLLDLSATTSVTGTLSGTGQTGAIKVNAGGTLAPGLSSGGSAAGTLTANGNLVMSNSTSSFSIRIGVGSATDNDELMIASGSASLNNATLVVTNGPNYNNSALNGLALIILTGYSQATSGQFSNGSFVTSLTNGDRFQILYGYDPNTQTVDAGGTDVALVVAVPEPETWAMIAGSLGLLVGAQRIRRRRQGI